MSSFEAQRTTKKIRCELSAFPFARTTAAPGEGIHWRLIPSSFVPARGPRTGGSSSESPGQDLSSSLKQLQRLHWVMFFMNKLTFPAKLISLEAQLCFNMNISKRLSSSSCLVSFLPRRLGFWGALVGISLREVEQP